MSLSTFYRLSGGALLLGGALAIVGQLLQIPSQPGPSLLLAGTSLALGGTLLIGLGWPGLYLRQMPRAGRLGLIGFILTFVGFLSLVGLQTTDAFVSPWLAAGVAQSLDNPQVFPALLLFELFCGLLLVVGPLLFSVATIRAAIFPRWVAVLLLVGAVASLVTVILHNWNEISGALFFLAIACFGVALWGNRAVAERDLSPSMLEKAQS